MRVIVVTDPGVVELNWMWLPTWIGMNANLKEKIEKEFKEKVEGKSLTEETLDEIHEELLNYLDETLNVEGLFDYLDGLKFVTSP